jgi:hypothetical protein
MKAEARKIYRAMLAFHKAAVVSIAHWSFDGAEFLLDLDNIRNPVQIGPRGVLGRISVPGFELDDSFIYPGQMTKESPARNPRANANQLPNLADRTESYDRFPEDMPKISSIYIHKPYSRSF